MTPSDLPIVATVVRSGADDRIFDSLLIVGPFVIGMVAVFGRSSVTEAVAVAYLALFVGRVLSGGVR